MTFFLGFFAKLTPDLLNPVQTFPKHKAVFPKTEARIKNAFLKNVKKSWVLQVAGEEKSYISQPSLWLAVNRFADEVLDCLRDYTDACTGEDGSILRSAGVHRKYEERLTEATVFATAQFVELRDNLDMGLDVDYLTKQIFFEVAAKYQATFKQHVMVNKAIIDPTQSNTWHDRVKIRNETKGEYLEI